MPLLKKQCSNGQTIPEPISFEIDMPISTDGQYIPFAESKSVFSIPVVKGFTTSLRMIRISVDDALTQEAVKTALREYVTDQLDANEKL